MMTMTTYLADSSAWIDYLRRRDSRLHTFMRDNSAGHTEPVAMELLSGTLSDDSARDVERLLRRSPFMAFDSAADFPAATTLRQEALRRGLRVGGIDCMILAVAARCSTPLITTDRPQAELAASMGLRVEFLADLRSG
jgi:predicted nucleic acid-binding protein